MDQKFSPFTRGRQFLVKKSFKITKLQEMNMTRSTFCHLLVIYSLNFEKKVSRRIRFLPLLQALYFKDVWGFIFVSVVTGD